MEALGKHLILEYYGVRSELLDDTERLEQIFNDAARDMRATIVSSHFHHFSPHGVSGAVVISESHLTVHTWPEYGYAAVDVFTCGNVIDPWEAHASLIRELEPARDSAMEFRRGTFDVPPGTLPEYYEVGPDGDDGK